MGNKKIALTAGAGLAAMAAGAVTTTQTVSADTVASAAPEQSAAVTTPAQKAQASHRCRGCRHCGRSDGHLSVGLARRLAHHRQYADPTVRSR